MANFFMLIGWAVCPGIYSNMVLDVSVRVFGVRWFKLVTLSKAGYLQNVSDPHLISEGANRTKTD